MSAARSKPSLSIVGAPPKRRELTPEELAERQRRRDHWAQVHIEGDRAPPLNLGHRARGIFRLGGGPRRERGGFKFEERP
jgi:hypothetical protein